MSASGSIITNHFIQYSHSLKRRTDVLWKLVSTRKVQRAGKCSAAAEGLQLLRLHKPALLQAPLQYPCLLARLNCPWV